MVQHPVVRALDPITAVAVGLELGRFVVCFDVMFAEDPPGGEVHRVLRVRLVDVGMALGTGFASQVVAGGRRRLDGRKRAVGRRFGGQRHRRSSPSPPDEF